MRKMNISLALRRDKNDELIKGPSFLSPYPRKEFSESHVGLFSNPSVLYRSLSCETRYFGFCEGEVEEGKRVQGNGGARVWPWQREWERVMLTALVQDKWEKKQRGF